MTLRDTLQARLRASMKARDRASVAAYRSALAAVANAEAVPVDTMPPAGAAELSPVGVGAADAVRRDLTDDDVRRIVEAEVAEREEARPHVTAERAETLAAEVAALRLVLDA